MVFPLRIASAMNLGCGLSFGKRKVTRLRLVIFYAFGNSRHIPRAWKSCTENHAVFFHYIIFTVLFYSKNHHSQGQSENLVNSHYLYTT
jgi:hypothetical protein